MKERQNDMFMGKTKLISLNDLSLEELEVDELIPLMTTDDEEHEEPVPDAIQSYLWCTVLFPG